MQPSAEHDDFEPNGPPQLIDLAGRQIEFSGDPSDPYFQSLPAHAANLGRLQAYLTRQVAPNAVCLDVGANIGLTAILLSLHCMEGEVHCFEGSPKNARYLRHNLAANGIANCFVVEAAVGARAGTALFHETPFGAGSYMVRDGGQTAHHPSARIVPMTTIDTFTQEALHSDKKIDFIKLDVEGSEPAVLAGAARTLAIHRCPIFMEFNSWCLIMHQHVSPLSFATAISDAFELGTLDCDGRLTSVGDNSAASLLKANLLEHRCVSDLLIRLKHGASIPSLEQMTKYGEDLENLRALRRLKELHRAWVF